MKRYIGALALLAAIIGGVAGLALPSPTSAQTGYRLDVDVAINPGGGLMSGSNGWLTCGWHQECPGTYPYGDGLDWDNFDNGTVYWRSYGWRSDSCDNCQVASTTLWTSNTSTCYRIRQDLVDWFGYYRGAEYYTHTTTPWNGYSNPVTAGANRWLMSEFAIGYSVTSDLATCPFGGSHVHQTSSGLMRNGLYPTGASLHLPSIGSYPIRSSGYWQHDVKWTWW